MKKFVIFLGAAMALHFVQGQGVAVGLKGGLNFPTIDGIEADDVTSSSTIDNASGYHIGGFLKIRAPKIGLQPEVLYSFQKSEFQASDGTGGTFNVEQKINYLTVPIMLRWYMVAGLNLQIGPQFGFVMDASQISTNTGAPTTTDLKDDLKAADVGINFGAGIDLPFGLDIHGRYILGVQDINESSNNDSKNSMWQVSLGYSLFGAGRD